MGKQYRRLDQPTVKISAVEIATILGSPALGRVVQLAVTSYHQRYNKHTCEGRYDLQISQGGKNGGNAAGLQERWDSPTSRGSRTRRGREAWKGLVHTSVTSPV